MYDANHIARLKINHPEVDLTIYSKPILDDFTDVSVLDRVPVVEKSVLPPNSDNTEINNPIHSDIKEVGAIETQKSGLSPS